MDNLRILHSHGKAQEDAIAHIAAYSLSISKTPEKFNLDNLPDWVIDWMKTEDKKDPISGQVMESAIIILGCVGQGRGMESVPISDDFIVIAAHSLQACLTEKLLRKKNMTKITAVRSIDSKEWPNLMAALLDLWVTSLDGTRSEDDIITQWGNLHFEAEVNPMDGSPWRRTFIPVGQFIGEIGQEIKYMKAAEHSKSAKAAKKKRKKKRK